MEEIKLSTENVSTLDKKSEQNSVKPVVKPLESSIESDHVANFGKQSIIFYFVMVLIGLSLGTGVYAVKNQNTTRIGGKAVEVVKTPTEEGVKDASSFKDTASGKIVLNDGKLTDEGTHILVRGDASQNVYLTSSVIDLSKYENKNVQIWGETFKGQKAGWLMDVGRIKIQN